MANETPKELDTDAVDAAIWNPLDPEGTEAGSAPSPSSASGNEFTARKAAAHAMMDAALFMANISQLRMLLIGNGATARFFAPLLCLIVFSIFCQILFAIIILVIWARETRLCKDSTPTASHPHPRNPSTSPHRAHVSIDDDEGISDKHLKLRPSHHNGAGCDNSQPDSTLLQSRVTIDVTRMTQRDSDEKVDMLTRWLHMVSLLLVFLITVANMFITGLGFDPTREHESELSPPQFPRDESDSSG